MTKGKPLAADAARPPLGATARKPLGADKRGSVSFFVIAALPPMLALGVFAIDAARVWVAEARLQAAVDAAALIGARDLHLLNGTDAQKTEGNANIRAVLAAYHKGEAPQHTVTQPAPGQVQIAGTVNVSPLTNRVAIGGKPIVERPPAVITRTGAANRTVKGVEVALVFDVTGSMLVSDGTVLPDGTRPTRIVAARDAALDFTGILYGGATTAKHGGEEVTTKEKLYISIVPYNVAVNLGPEYTGWLSSANAPTYSHGHTWAGCVEARRNGYDVRDDAPNRANSDTMFRRYFWASTYNSLRTSANNSSCLSTQDYDSNRACQGNNDWTAPADLQRRNHLIQAWGGRGAKFGPNFMCPNIPVLPLTMRKETVEAHIRSMVGTAERPYPFSSGTSVASGLQAAWYTLSPKWQGLWRNHDHPSTQRPALPLPYKPEDSIKVMILLSDGDNNWLSARGALSASRLVRPENRQTELFYNTYGNLASNRLGISVPGIPIVGAAGGGDDDDDDDDDDGGAPVRTEAQLASDYRTVRPRADAALDDATRRTCEKIKEAGIKIWAVGLGVMELAHRRLMEDCVSTPDNEDRKNGITSYYVHTDNLGQLTAAFTQIASQLVKLRLVK